MIAKSSEDRILVSLGITAEYQKVMEVSSKSFSGCWQFPPSVAIARGHTAPISVGAALADLELFIAINSLVNWFPHEATAGPDQTKHQRNAHPPHAETGRLRQILGSNRYSVFRSHADLVCQTRRPRF